MKIDELTSRCAKCGFEGPPLAFNTCQSYCRRCQATLTHRSPSHSHVVLCALCHKPPPMRRAASQAWPGAGGAMGFEVECCRTFVKGRNKAQALAAFARAQKARA
jgi:hypothetical protein